MSIEALLALLAALAAGLSLSALRQRSDRRAAEARLDRAQAAAREADRRAREAEAAAAAAEAKRQREAEQAAIRKDLDDGLQKVESDLPGAVADALRESRERRGGGA